MTFEETLFYTSLDIDLNSFEKDDDITTESLLEITKSNLESAFSCDHLDLTPRKIEQPSIFMLNSFIDSTLQQPPVWKDIKSILMSNEPTIQTSEAPTYTRPEYINNHIFSRFEHLFDYEGCYHSYLMAKVFSEHIYSEDAGAVNGNTRKIFEKGGSYDYKNNMK
jgi:hypothetical protein